MDKETSFETNRKIGKAVCTVVLSLLVEDGIG